MAWVSSGICPYQPALILWSAFNFAAVMFVYCFVLVLLLCGEVSFVFPAEVIAVFHCVS